MSNNRSKTPSTSRKMRRKTEALKMLARASIDAPVEVSLEVLPVVTPPLIVEALQVVEPPPAVEALPVAIAPLATMPDRHQIARLAFARFVARGYVHGRHVEDWLAAEAELLAR